MSTIRLLHEISARTARNSLKWLYLLVYSKVKITTYAGRPFYFATRSVLRGTLARGKKGRKSKKSLRKEEGLNLSHGNRRIPREWSSYSLRFQRRSSISRPHILCYSVFFYHLIKQSVTRSTPNPTMQKAVFEKSYRFSRTLRIIFIRWTNVRWKTIST